MITSASNPLIKEVQALIAGRKKRDETGLFTAEGKKIFLEAPKELIEKVIVSEAFEKAEPDFLKGVAHETVSDSLFAKISDTKTPQGILTVFRKPVNDPGELIAGNTAGHFSERAGRFLVILEDLQDPGNVGTIIRTAEGAGADGVIFGRGCADVFSPKVIRSTMGSVFRVPFLFSEDLKKTVGDLHGYRYRVYGSFLSGSVEYTGVDYGGNCAVIIGNEGRGMTRELADCCDGLIRIPMEGKLESLNAGVAASLIMYAAHYYRFRHEQYKGKAGSHS